MNKFKNIPNQTDTNSRKSGPIPLLPSAQHLFRILVADDEMEYLNLYQCVFAENNPINASTAYTSIFPDSKDWGAGTFKFELTCCSQGDGAIDQIKQSIEENRPFSAAFLDVRMPPGPDGVWVAKQIRNLDPLIEIAIVTGFSDYPLADIISRIPPVHKLVYIQKPFKLNEIYHIAYSLCAKRLQEDSILNINRGLEKKVAERTRELETKNKHLVHEINQRIVAEEALRNSERNYRLLVENQLDMIVKFDTNGRILFASPSYCIAQAQPQADLIGKDFISFSHPDERGKVTRAIERAYRPPFTAHVEERVQSRQGWRWYAWVYTAVTDNSGKARATLAVGRDITAGKKVELDLKESRQNLQVLYSHVVKAQEEERKRIASDLHDDLGQTLAVLKLRMQSIKNQLRSEQSDLDRECEDTLSYISQIMEQVRRISHDLTPALLDDMGLGDCLIALADEFAELSQTKLTMKMADIDNLFPNTSGVIIYRVFQEILTNIQKHSGSHHVAIQVKKRPDDVFFQISDSGRGFDMEKQKSTSSHDKGLGLTSMEQRVKMLGGRLDIQSHPGEGTTISFSIPV